MKENTPQKSRPLSPHLSIYKLQISSGTSALHRITGAGLYVGFLALSFWLAAILLLGDQCECLKNFSLFKPWWGKVILTLWAYGLYYHMLNGIRHLFWDAVMGLDLKTVHLTGYLVIAGSVILTVLSFLYIY